MTVQFLSVHLFVNKLLTLPQPLVVPTGEFTSDSVGNNLDSEGEIYDARCRDVSEKHITPHGVICLD